VAHTELRVLHVAEAFGGGLFEVVRMISVGLARQGVATAVAYGRRPETPELVRDEVDPAVELFAMPWTSRTPRAQLAAARRLRQVVHEWRPDVVHLHSSFAGAVGAVALGRRVPTVYTPHAYSFTIETRPVISGTFRLVERAIARRVSAVVATSRSEARLALSTAGARAVAVVENGIPELEAGPAPAPRSDSRPRAVAAGRIGGQRQPEACARILASVKDVADVCWIGGAGNSPGGHAALKAADIPVTGWLDREGVLDRLGDATVYLHWTAWDGLPLSILEAMARDVVVVASDIGPNREVLGPDQVRADEEGAAELLRVMLTDPARRSAAIEEQRRRRGRYSASRMVEEWTAVYRRLSESPRAEWLVPVAGPGER
jgi:glycosyltransferase involved in cell wall biosynthesis